MKVIHMENPLTLLFPVCKLKNKFYPNRSFRLESNDTFQEAKFWSKFSVTGFYLIHLCPWDPVVQTLPGSADCTSSWAAPCSHHLTSIYLCPSPFHAWPQHYLSDLEWREAGKKGINTFDSPPSSQIPVFNNTGVHRVLSLSTQQLKLIHFQL